MRSLAAIARDAEGATRRRRPPTPGGTRPERRRLTVASLLTLSVVAYLLAIRFAPTLLDVRTLPDPAEQQTADGNARVAVTSAGAALAVAAGLIFTAFNYGLARRGQAATQVATALSQLSSDELYVRVGGIRALEPLIRSSPDHRLAILDVLTTFIRHNAPQRPVPGKGPVSDSGYGPDIHLPERPSPDIQAALTVLGQHGSQFGRPLDLANLHLTNAALASARLDGATLADARLDRADLRGVDLTGGDLHGASLRAADLRGAQLGGAILDGVCLQDAKLADAQLIGASLRHAELGRADLEHARLSHANLSGATIKDAHLWAASLQGAILVAADLTSADLRYADLSNANLYRAALAGADLRFADGRDTNVFEATTWSTTRFSVATNFDLSATLKVAPDSAPASPKRTGGERAQRRRLLIGSDLNPDLAGDRPSRSTAGPPTNMGKTFSTNVAKLLHEVPRIAPDGVEQLTFYQRGRISSGPGALEQDVLDAYRFLVQNFNPGDSIYLVGFSRGAYIVRTLVGMVSRCGIVKRDEVDRIPEAYRLYRSPAASSAADFSRIDFRHRHAHESDIEFLGVWESIGPLGVPSGRLGRIGPRHRRLQFHDTILSQCVRGAYQALAIDEQRFNPVVWQTQGRTGQHVEQVWFPGSHGDVGGLYRDAELSDAPLTWMMDRAREHRLGIRNDVSYQVRTDIRGVVHDWRIDHHRLQPARIRPICATDTASEHISNEAIQRVRLLPDYRPPNLMQALSQNSASSDERSVTWNAE